MKKITLKNSLLLILILIGGLSFAQNAFTEVKISKDDVSKMLEINMPLTARVFSFDVSALQSKLNNASYTNFAFPNSEGKSVNYNLKESSLMEDELQRQYPEIKSYAGYGDNGEYMRLTASPYNGVNGIILTKDRSNSISIQNIKGTDKSAVYKRNSASFGADFECTTPEIMEDIQTDGAFKRAADDGILRTFRIAISTTGEYAQFHGGTLGSVNAAIVTSLVRINSVFELDFAVRLVLIAGNDVNIYLDGGSDPYSGTSSNNYNQDLADTLDQNLADGDYDIGHLYAGIGNGGSAGCIGCVCINGNVSSFNHKGSGFTSSAFPIGDRWDIDFVAHEMGHQFGGFHTFTHQGEGSGISQMEPGSGTTIMGYAGITGPSTDVQQVSDPYFHAISIQTITAHAKSRSCDTETATGNAIPVVDAGSNITLPIGTPFVLTGSATDGDTGDNLSYCWEQFDENNAANAFPNPSNSNSNEPLFRSYSPSDGTSRSFPKIEDLLANGVNGNVWEKVPTVGRFADFRLTVRDNAASGGGNNFDNMRVTWDASKGPLEVTSQSEDGILWSSGDPETIVWNVNSTNTMSGASNVDILLSIDGGLTYPITLASGVANNGSASITVPNNPAPYCRVRVQPTNAPFFAINSTDFSIDFLVTTDCSEVYTSNPNFAIPDNGTQYSGLGLTTPSTSTLGGPKFLKLGLDVSHTYIGDLQFLLQSPAPNQTQVIPFTQGTCGNFADMNIQLFDTAPDIICANPISGDVKTANAFSAFDGQSVGGQWVLAVIDTAGEDTGTLNSWSLTICEEVAIPLSIDENSLENSFAMYPNPTNGMVTIAFETLNDTNIDLYDISGRLVYSDTFKYSNNQFNEELNLNYLSTGVYMVKIKSGTSTINKKLVIN